MALSESLPWTRSPLIINAPMGGFAGGALAAAVSNAGGLGLIGSTNDMGDLATQLKTAASSLTRTATDLLPIGVGLLTFMTSLDKALSLLQKHKPAVLWLFAATNNTDYATWTSRLRSALPSSQVWIQTGSVAASLTITTAAKPDVLCIQGSDAGGHGYEKGAGLITLLPEISDALASHPNRPFLVAAGGISSPRSGAAALTLGAQGLVIGTLFLSAQETNIHPLYQKALLRASDGGQTTTRSKLFDNLRGPNPWPTAYDGRSLVMESFVDWSEKGKGIEEVRRLHAEATEDGDGQMGFGVDGQGRAAMWAGTGVGMIKSVRGAGEIVREMREGTARVLREVGARL